ncbi:MAG: patatin-like phospholipase family protein [Archangium sp.]|nr:patatin-like phospholipase family protein [Archangium sp.]
MTSRLGGWVALLAFSSGCVVADLTNRPVFADLTYAADDRTPPSPKVEFQLYAELQLTVVGPWNDPRAAAQCLGSLAGADLQRIGSATSGARDATTWATALWAELASLRTSPACTAGFTSDPAQLAWALGKASGSAYDFAELTWLSNTHKPATYDAAASALKRLARVLDATPANQAAQNDLPVLAMSGGAANGAFTAGLLYELLSAREEALSKLPAGDRAEADRASRFSAVVGTSVGALLAQLLEFAMLDDSALTPEQQAFVTACNAFTPRPEVKHSDLSGAKTDCFSGWPNTPFPTVPAIPGRPVQSCALKLLERYFSDVDEADLMCAEQGSVARALGVFGRPRVNLIRFDPMQRAPLDPLIDLFHQQMHDNRLTRVVVSVETQQSQLVGLDERACGGADSPKCLSAGLMASLVLPVFARPVSHVWSGFEPAGECGVWVDGGLRSQLPAIRALSYSRPTPLTGGTALRVLAIDTGRLTPVATPPPRMIADMVFTTLEQYAAQQDLTELAFAQRLAELRDEELTALLAQAAPVTPLKRLSRPSAADQRVRGLYVPGDVPDWVVAGAGYSFDRYVMRGLFIWGRQVARRQLGASGDLATRLGWPAPLPTEVAAIIAQRETDAAFQTWLVEYSKPVCPAFSTWRSAEGRTRINTSMPLCVEASQGPAYFACPSGSWAAGGAP